jgi:flavorubredoxin
LLTRFVDLVAAAQREKVVHWMRSMGYATGHGDTIEDLLNHLGTQIAEGLEVEVLMEREACADICDQHASVEGIAQRCAEQIRARSKE